MVNIKVIHKEGVRRFTLPTNATWIELEAKLRTLFSIPALSPFTLSYTDEDSDVITLSTDIELQDILSSAPTVKFNLKFSTSDDSSESEDSGNEVWVLEGGNVSQRKRASSVITIDSDISQDNVTQKNLELHGPQHAEIVPRDKEDEATSNTNIQVDDDLKISEDKKTTQVNLLDDEFFESINSMKLTTPIQSQPQSQPQPQPQPELEFEPESESESELESELETQSQPEFEIKEQTVTMETTETSSSSNVFTHPTFLEQDQPRYQRYQRQQPEVNLQQFQHMIELNQDAIKENPHIVANILNVMEQIKQLDSYRPPTMRNNLYSHSITPPISARHTLSVIPPTTEFTRSLTPPIPGSFPRQQQSVEVAWAAKDPKDQELCQGDRKRFNHNYHNDDNIIRHEQEEEKSEESQTQELTDFHIEYSDQLKMLNEMGLGDENKFFEYLVKYDGDVNRVVEALFS